MSDISCPACGALIPVPNDDSADDALRFASNAAFAFEKKRDDLRKKVAELEQRVRDMVLHWDGPGAQHELAAGARDVLANVQRTMQSLGLCGP